MKMTQFAKFANNATKQILGTSGLIRENLQSMFSYPNAIDTIPVIVSGDVIHIEDAAPMNAKNVMVNIEHVQDLHGYDNPWPAGGWKNKFPQAEINVGGSNPRTIDVLFETPIPVGIYTLSYTKSGTGSIYGVELFASDDTRVVSFSSGNPATRTLTTEAVRAFIYMDNSEYSDGKTITLSNIQLESGSTATAYAPYENICPISGWTGANITVNGNTIAIAFPYEAGTVYGGTLDVTTGLLTVTHDNIASYNGESLSGKWISSMDVYSAGGTPTTGAQVVYELATPQTYQLTPQQITLLRGNNTLYADCGSMELEYYRIEDGGSPYV